MYFFSRHPQILFVRKSLYQRFSIGWPFRYLGFLLYSVQCTKNLLLWSLSPQEDNRFLILFRYLILDKWICKLDCFNFQRTYSLPLLNSQDTVQDICTVFWNSIFGQGRGRLKVGFFPCRTWLIIQTNLTLFDFQLHTGEYREALHCLQIYIINVIVLWNRAKIQPHLWNSFWMWCKGLLAHMLVLQLLQSYEHTNKVN